MRNQPDLFARVPYNGNPPAQRHSTTSTAAAESIRSKIGPLHKRVMAFLKQNPNGATDEQLMSALDLGGNTLRPRRRELQLMGLLRDSGRTALTCSGRHAVVWVATGNV